MRYDGERMRRWREGHLTSAEGVAGLAADWGLYVHVPFCPYKCAYCDFVAVGAGPRVARWHEPYVADLAREARHWAASLAPRPPVTVFYGGGTPTMLGAERLSACHAELIRCLRIAPGTEVTVEANPGTVDAQGLRRLRAAGVNRLSIGLQTAEDRLLRALGRGHTYGDFLEAWSAARAAGFDNLSVDVMYGLPGQTTADVERTVAGVLEMGPEHVSAYGLQIEDGTPFAVRERQGRLPLPDDDEVCAQFAAVRAALAAAGYEHYEISNFARPGRRCRHNLLYWQNADYLGLGVGAHSHWAGARWSNTTRLAAYRDGVRDAAEGAVDPPWVQGREFPDAARDRSEGAFLGLRLLEGIDLGAYAARYGRPLSAAFPGVVERLVGDGLCEVSGGHLRLRPDAVGIGNRAFVAFV